MSSYTFSWKPLLENFGAEVDIDLSVPMTPEQERGWKTLYRERRLLLVRGQQLSDEDQIRCTQMFGPLVCEEGGETIHYISNTRADGGLGNTEIIYHSDLSFAPFPYDCLCLYAFSLEDGASSTRWADSAGAYAYMPPDLKEKLDGRRVLNVITNVALTRNCYIDKPAEIPAAEYPIVRERQPDGLKYLFTNQQTDHIVGLSADESNELLDRISSYLYDPDNIFEHFWCKGDLILWDNLTSQHARSNIEHLGERTLRRVVVGRKNLSEQYPDFMGEIDKSYGKGLLPDDQQAQG